MPDSDRFQAMYIDFADNRRRHHRSCCCKNRLHHTVQAVDSQRYRRLQNIRFAHNNWLENTRHPGTQKRPGPGTDVNSTAPKPYSNAVIIIAGHSAKSLSLFIGLPWCHQLKDVLRAYWAGTLNSSVTECIQ